MEQEKRELLDKTFQTFMDVGLGGENLDQLHDTVAEDVVGFGTTIDEKIFGIKELQNLLIRQKEQSAGMEMSWKINTFDTHISSDENTAIFTNDLILYVTIDGNTIEMYMRFSVVLDYVQNKWMVVHWHGSKPEHVESEKDTWGIATWKEKAEELEKQVAERTADLVVKNRELEIEAATERVRAQSMAMHHPEDLDKVNKELLAQLNKLEVPGLTGVSFYLLDQEGIVTVWDLSSPGNMTNPNSYTFRFDSKKLPVMGEFVETLNSTNEDYFVLDYPKEKILLAIEELKDIDVEIANLLMKAVESGALQHQWNPAARITDGILSIDLITQPTNETKTIVLKMAGAFNLAYQRFLDLLKVEAQAKESKIQLALERVRARTMAMQHSDELQDAAILLFQQVKALGVQTGSCGFNIWNKNEKTATVWMSSAEGGLQAPFILPHTESTIYKQVYKARKNGELFLVKKVDGIILKKHFDYLLTLPGIGEVIKKLREASYAFPKTMFYHFAFFSQGYLSFHLHEHNPESHDIFKRFAKVFEQTYTRFLDLQKAEAQSREAQIEAALERVRAKSMAMHKTSELQDVINTVNQQLKYLEVDISGGAFITMNSTIEEKVICWGSGGTTDYIHEVIIPFIDRPIYNGLVEGIMKGPGFFTEEFTYEEKQEFFKHLFLHPPYSNTLDSLKKDVLARKGGYARSCAVSDHTSIFINNHHGIKFSEQDNEILKRIGRVFDQAYARFLDIQKAEAQAKEAHIEAGLERVRSAAMAMHRSDDLRFSLTKLFEELDKLNLAMIRCGIAIMDPSKPRADVWIMAKSGDNNTIQLSGDEPLDTNFMLMEAYEAWKMGNDYEYTLEGKKISEYYSSLDQNEFQSDLSSSFSNEIKTRKQHYFNAVFKHGSLFAFFEDQMPDFGRTILKRFSNVLNLAYSRFHDIQFAEAQAHEAQIENALEKVRSRSLAMQNPGELIEVAQLLRDEMGALGVEELETSSIYIIDEENEITQCWFTIKNTDDPNKAVSDQMIIELEDTWVGQKMLEFYHSKEQNTSILMQGDHRIEWIRYCEKKSDLFSSTGFYGETIPERTYHLYKFSDGFIGAAAPGEISSESWDLLKRATSVFSFAYTRFLDLQKAEGQAQEAKIELSLERIRSQVTSMLESSDLLDIVVSMRSEFVKLGHEAHYFWHMRWLPERYDKAMTSGDGTKIGMVMTLPRHIHGDIPLVAEWEKTKEPTVVLAMDAETAVEYVHKMITLGDFEQVDPKAPSLDDVRHIGGLTFIMARTTHGEIGFSLPGVVPNPPKESVDTLVRFAGVFDLAYKRFEDLKTSEKDLIEIKAAREKAEEALLELKATQSQLVQQEKLASLGQLTAGIAHEIKNPLNFVNNFSEVSLELIEEVMEEVKAQGLAPQQTITEILKDIESNLRKIHDHGSRANSIVTSMLQHSRGGTGEKGPTDLNALVKEYVNLCFHGMRAAKNPINVSISLDLEPNIHEVSLIHEDFTRVIINLCNNAFDAMRQKKLLDPEDYQPKLSVRTKSDRDSIVIEVEDNGPGIPDDIKDKILQPFFTTKKGTEGTGLGLSITHDIVQAHGGDLRIKSKVGNGSTFQIYLQV